MLNEKLSMSDILSRLNSTDCSVTNLEYCIKDLHNIMLEAAKSIRSETGPKVGAVCKIRKKYWDKELDVIARRKTVAYIKWVQSGEDDDYDNYKLIKSYFRRIQRGMIQNSKKLKWLQTCTLKIKIGSTSIVRAKDVTAQR